MKRAAAIAVWILSAAMLAAQSESPAPDSDRDGIPDATEQALLERFRPVFLVSATDCAQLPSEFAPNTAKPVIGARNGTIYGQVFRGSQPNTFEIHYYTLWDRDCGRNGHALDAEHVSALVATGAQDGTREAHALYWYAGAHEDTVCETSSAARARIIGAEERGPRVWSSSGKHALYLEKEQCGRGCGGDRCDDNLELKVTGPVINLGELTHPMNGAAWIGSQKWPLRQKMSSDFTPELLAALEAAPEAMVSLAGKGRRAARAMVLGGDSSLDGLASGARHTGSALGVADDKASKSMDKATHATGNSVARAAKAAFRWMKPKDAKSTKP